MQGVSWLVEPENEGSARVSPKLQRTLLEKDTQTVSFERHLRIQYTTSEARGPLSHKMNAPTLLVTSISTALQEAPE